MAKQQIGLLFGMAGESSIDTGSGKIIKDQLNEIVDALNKSSSTKIKFQYEFNVSKVQKEIQKATEGVKKQTGSLNKQLNNALNKLAGMGGNADKRTYANTGIEAVNIEFKEYIRLVDEAKKVAAIKDKTPEQMQEVIDKTNAAVNQQKKLQAVFSNSTAFEKQETVYQKVIARITEYQAKFKETLKNTPQLAAQLENLRQLLSTPGAFVGTENKANQEFVKLTNQIRQAGGEAETLGQKIRRIFGEKLGYGIIASAAMMARQALRQVYTNVVELDKAVVDLQIATGKNRKEVKELVATYSELGRELGATTSEVAKGADSWLRQGYSIEETNELVRQSIMLSKLSGLDSAEATQGLTSAIKGYKLEASEASKVVDMLVAIDMEAAVTSGDLTLAMSECANSARLAGIDMQTLLGYLTVIKEVTQDDAGSVGNFAKTMLARMGNIKAGNLEDPETGENLSDVETVLDGLGIKLRSANNQFRDFDEVLAEVADKWNTYSNVQQRAIANAFGLTRQQEKFLVLMENFPDALKFAETATKSVGTANQKYEAVLSSVEAAQNSFTASFEDFSQAFLDSDLVAGVIRFGDGFMQVLTSITKFLSFGDGLVGQLALITAGLWALNAAMVAFNTQTGIFASTGEPIEALTYHAREYSGGDTERVNKIIVLFTREYLEKPTSLGLIA